MCFVVRGKCFVVCVVRFDTNSIHDTISLQAGLPGSPVMPSGSTRSTRAGLGTRPSSCPNGLSSYRRSSSPLKARLPSSRQQLLQSLQKGGSAAIGLGRSAPPGDSHDAPEFYDEELEAEPARLGARPAVPPNAPLMPRSDDTWPRRGVHQQRVSTRRLRTTRSMVSDVREPASPTQEDFAWRVYEEGLAARELQDADQPLFMQAASRWRGERDST